MRQDTVSKINHPDPLRIGDMQLVRIDDPGVDTIQTGDAGKGWEGDSRLCVYWNPKFKTWELWRLEGNGEYMLTQAWVAQLVSANDIADVMVRWLVKNDTHRGFDVYQYVMDENEKLDRLVQQEQDALMANIAERLPHAIEKDGLV